jgi:hypothetical protein
MEALDHEVNGSLCSYGRMLFMGDDTEAEITVDEELPPGALGRSRST